MPMHANVHVVQHAPVSSRDHRGEDRGRGYPRDRDGGDQRARQDVRDRDRGFDRDRDRDRGRGIDRDRDRGYAGGWVAPAPIPAPAPTPIAVLAATPLDSSALTIDTAGLLAGRTTLELEASGSGSTYVQQIVLYTADGTYQVVSLNAMLSPQSPSTQISIGPDVVRVVVVGHSGWDAALSLAAW